VEFGNAGWRIERTIRLFGQDVFKRIYSRRRPAPKEIGPVARILLVRTDKIGDAIISTPVISALRGVYPAARIDILLGERNKVAAPLLPQIDSVLVTSRNWRQRFRTLREIRARGYDLAINLVQADSLTAGFFTALSSARVKVGAAGTSAPYLDIVVDQPLAPHPHVIRLLRLLEPLGINVELSEAKLQMLVSSDSLAFARQALGPAPAGASRVMVNISASSPRKFWGVARYAALARTLQAKGMEVLLVGAPPDRQRLDKIAAQSGARAIAPRDDIMEFAALLSFADVVVSPDTSTIHIAAALGKPVVALVNDPVTAIEWAPWGVPNRVLGGDVPVTEIDEADVLAAVQSLLPKNG
jgi:heptosyltransferase III